MLLPSVSIMRDIKPNSPIDIFACSTLPPALTTRDSSRAQSLQLKHTIDPCPPAGYRPF